MKTILIAVDTFYPKKDGVVRFLENVVPRLSEKYRIKIIAPKYNGNGFAIKNVEVIKLPVSKKRQFAGYHSVIWDNKAKNILKKSVKESDLVFSQDVALLGRKAVIYGRKYKKPTVNYVHQIIWEQFGDIATKHRIIKSILIAVIKYLTKRVYGKCSLLFVPSVTVAEQLKNEGVFKEKAIVPLGVNIKKFKPAENRDLAKINIGIDPNKFVIGYCGRISKEKDLETLREAFVQVNEKHKNALLLIIGGGDPAETENLMKTHGIKVTGFVKDVVPYLQALDVFVLPSLTETTSLATMEAMACGVPAITTPAGRLKEYVKNNFNGYLFPKRSVEALAKRIEEIMNDKKKAHYLGRNARWAMLDFSWESTIRKMEELFEKLEY